jgi:hypothetical protein
VEVSDFSGAFCVDSDAVAANEVTVTFLAPNYGPNGADIEAMGIVYDDYTISLVGAGLTHTVNGAGVITVTEQVKGTRALHNDHALGRQAGGAYFFELVVDGSTSSWVETAKVLHSSEYRESGDQFGFDVKLSPDSLSAAISAPGERLESGAVYIFTRPDANSATWTQQQRITSVQWGVTENDRFGQSIDMDDSMLLVGAPGVDVGIGAAYVFKINDAGIYLADQIFNPPSSTQDEGVDPTEFGSSVTIGVHTIAVGAEAEDVEFVDCGSVYVYARSHAVAFFELQQQLVPSDPHRFDHFGRAVAMQDDVVVVGHHFPFSNTLTPRRSMQQVTTSLDADYAVDGDVVGGTFRLGWQAYKDGHVWQQVQTRQIDYDESAVNLKRIMMEDLGTGELIISRKGPDVHHGYTWVVTFAEYDGNAPPLTTRGQLTGSGVDIVADVLSVPNDPIRDGAYLFTRTGTVWTEQAALRPNAFQPSPLFGHDVALDGQFGVVGAPNRDTFVSGSNSGAAILFNLNFLNLKFTELVTTVGEGDASGLFTMTVQRCGGGDGDDCVLATGSDFEDIVYFYTGDYVSDADPTVLRQLTRAQGGVGARNFGTSGYGAGANGWLAYDQVGTATGRSQFYGSTVEGSKFVGGQFDYGAVSDYTPTSGSMVFGIGVNELTFDVLITNDDLVEYPDETINLRLNLPGFWPSKGGNLWSVATIEDDGDGYGTAGLTGYTHKLLGAADADVNDAEILAALNSDRAYDRIRLGTAVAISDTDAVAVIGAEDNGVGGCAYWYERKVGVWSYGGTLETNVTLVEKARFGASVSIDDSHVDEERPRVVVGAPGAQTVYVFVWNGADGWDEEAVLSVPASYQKDDEYASTRAVSVFGNFIVVGAAGLETAYVFQREVEDGGMLFAWGAGVEIRAPDYDYDEILRVDYLHRQRFGCSVAVSGRTLAIGAEQSDYGNRGTPFIETYGTDGIDNTFFGKGAAYIFHLQPQIQTITLRADAELTTGEFVLSLDVHSTDAVGGLVSNGTFLGYSASEADMKSAVEGLDGVGHVKVTRSGNGKVASEFGYVWTVTFFSEVEDFPLLEPAWNSYNCSFCEEFSSGYSGNDAGIPSWQHVQVQHVQSVGTAWEFDEKLQASDKNNADRFGFAVSLDNDQLAVSAPYSSALTTTTWDFETGDLVGWRRTGTAFDTQPTYGENTIFRSTYGGVQDRLPGQGQPTHHQGRYVLSFLPPFLPWSSFLPFLIFLPCSSLLDLPIFNFLP